MEFYLASQSPRRSQLLSEYGFEFKKIKIHCDEDSYLVKDPKKYVKTLSIAKAKSANTFGKKGVLMSADTTVYSPQYDLILNKPAHFDEGVEMLKKLSNKVHHVFTGYCLLQFDGVKIKKVVSKVVKTSVTFRELPLQEIQYYIKKFQPFDKAGAYGIQEYGSFFVKKINGSYSNIIGLPMPEIISDLRQFNVYSKFFLKK